MFHPRFGEVSGVSRVLWRRDVVLEKLTKFDEGRGFFLFFFLFFLRFGAEKMTIDENANMLHF